MRPATALRLHHLPASVRAVATTAQMHSPARREAENRSTFYTVLLRRSAYSRRSRSASPVERVERTADPMPTHVRGHWICCSFHPLYGTRAAAASAVCGSSKEHSVECAAVLCLPACRAVHLRGCCNSTHAGGQVMEPQSRSWPHARNGRRLLLDMRAQKQQQKTKLTLYIFLFILYSFFDFFFAHESRRPLCFFFPLFALANADVHSVDAGMCRSPFLSRGAAHCGACQCPNGRSLLCTSSEWP
ncbi:hypothetical protein ABB37_00407 [Leptomonas pyrrhocoris]|uniref:Uncharacterized protein n=1 Tax=Leptomonas pyrrhocoris TaxID=157538 RepID=A0A0N0E085_LEPPY|nr:hypothetical protein ABB37_00399 [Leptomonas pyrrhocoris]XP_015664591.1 hypothetical protein ABB37_00401 [Leptomonas pyrrhocoris]XP_015664593.1 hypothetical protein ABB37_00403 [Leptomonas pyrrhocoris]XP_015664595.1 hypothetical protein ABB37_00405 [Leptomonas pyrrhocoris]XP_015664597.1 hypothetical protein ABB37_00407 [Leptomonas pyrrhocoris]KPA86150.1 hypothetical protein ABB37_00399 [Leptomonas pyrrhocoris]KPA86152.1 hypothetical protein ABB37_00401 [Leptomonas pyrrhocoris]KPA86154.1 h|eukprot:XP_015664589.1 hypothetical protein ABB37_00399 [Leptomonas pyrrhocoris]